MNAEEWILFGAECIGQFQLTLFIGIYDSPRKDALTDFAGAW